MKVGILINSLQGGGAERAALRLASDLKSQNDVVLFTLHEDRDFYKLPDSMIRINLGDIYIPKFTKSFFGFPKKFLSAVKWIYSLKRIRKIIKTQKLDVLIVFESFVGVVIAMSLMNSGIPLIVSERVNPDPHIYSPHFLSKLLRPFIYKHGVVCTVQTQGFAEWCRENWSINSVVIPNHFEESIYKKFKRFPNTPVFVAAGRNHNQKGFLLLLEAWKIVENKCEDARLNLITSDDNSNLKAKILELDLRRVSLMNPTNQIFEELDKATCLVSSSFFEGFPNIVFEALARGLFVVATNSTDILFNLANDKGFICVPKDNPQELGDAMLRICKLTDYEKLSLENIGIASNFKWENVSSKWDEAIKLARKSNGLKVLN
jgi:glycosyltransferase involved in cell wall biosynthesis